MPNKISEFQKLNKNKLLVYCKLFSYNTFYEGRPSSGSEQIV